MKSGLNWHQTKKKINSIKTQINQSIVSDVLYYSDKYVPLDTGTLKNSGIKFSDFIRGRIIWRTPYARKQYYYKYFKSPVGRATGKLRGVLWFDRMWMRYKKTIIKKAERRLKK